MLSHEKFRKYFINLQPKLLHRNSYIAFYMSMPCISVFVTQVSGADIRWYLQAFGYGWVALSLVAQMGLVLVAVGQDGLLSLWTSDAKDVQGLEGWTELRDSRLALYAVLGLLQGEALDYLKLKSREKGCTGTD